LAEFAIKNKNHMATKMSPFTVNYGRKLRMGRDIRKKEKVESAIEFVKKIKKVYEKTEAVLKKMQEKIKRYID